MSESQKITNLEQLLDRLGETESEGDPVSLRMVLETVGSRSFAPLLLVAGLLAFAPGLGDIPGVPTIVGVFVLLVAGQLLFHRKHLWLPRWLLDRSVSREKLRKALRWLRPPARFIDRCLRPRLVLFTHATGIAVACLIIAATMPVMEVVPFVANGAGAALAAFGLAMIAHDGVLALIAFAVTGVTGAATLYYLV